MRPFRINGQNIYQADRCRINIVYLIKIWPKSYILVVIVEVSLNHESLSKLWAFENIDDRYSQALLYLAEERDKMPITAVPGEIASELYGD